MFEFWIDGTKYDNPSNWNEFTETIEYDDQLKVFVFKYENKLRFSGGVYSYLYSKRNSGGICYVADVTIKGQCSDGSVMKDILRGKIFIADCLFFVNTCTVECSLHDDNYSAMIFNNSNIKVQLEQFESKNGLLSSGTLNGMGLTYLNTATPNSMVNVVNYFNPIGGAAVPGVDTKIYFIHDVFNYLVGFLTDGLCEFRSDYLNWTLPIVTELDRVKYLTITDGHNIRVYGTNDQRPISVSFSQLFKEVNRLYPIVLTVEYNSAGTPIIRIEDEASTRLSASSITLNNLPDVREKSDNSLLFGSVHVGAPTATYDPSIHTYEPTSSITFTEENYYLTGFCNTSTEKDLFGEFIADTNVIEGLTLTDTSNRSYENNIIFIEVDPASVTFGGVFDAIQTINYDNPANYHYNDNLLNSNVIKRHQFHNNIAGADGTGGASLENLSNSAASTVALGTQYDCSASSMPPAQTSAYQDLFFAIDNASVFDGQKYTALASGSYSFYYRLPYFNNIDTTALCYSPISINRTVFLTTKVERYNAANVLQETQIFNSPSHTSAGSHVHAFNATFTMLIGDYIQASSRYTSQPINFLQASSVKMDMFFTSSPAQFHTTSTPAYNGEIFASSGFNYLCNIVNFSWAIPQTLFETLKSNISNSILYNIDGKSNKKAWIKRVTRTTATSETEWELISDINNSQ